MKSWSRPWKRGGELFSGWKNMDRTKFLIPLLPRQRYPTLNSVSGIYPGLYQSGRLTCWKIWRSLTGSPPTSCSTQVKRQKAELETVELLLVRIFPLTISMNLMVFFQVVTNIHPCFAGPGPANSLKMDDFSEKVIDHARMNSHSAPLVKPNNQHVVWVNIHSVYR